MTFGRRLADALIKSLDEPARVTDNAKTIEGLRAIIKEREHTIAEQAEQLARAQQQINEQDARIRELSVFVDGVRALTRAV